MIYQTWPICAFSQTVHMMILHNKCMTNFACTVKAKLRVVLCWLKSGNSYTVTRNTCCFGNTTIIRPLRCVSKVESNYWGKFKIDIDIDFEEWPFMIVIPSTSVTAISWNVLSFSSLLHILLINLFLRFLSVPRVNIKRENGNIVFRFEYNGWFSEVGGYAFIGD